MEEIKLLTIQNDVIINKFNVFYSKSCLKIVFRINITFVYMGENLWICVPKCIQKLRSDWLLVYANSIASQLEETKHRVSEHNSQGMASQF